MPLPDPYKVWDRSDHEDKNRHDKVMRLVGALVSYKPEPIWDTDPLWNESPSELERFWSNLAAKNGINYPSETTRKQALVELRHYRMRTR